MRGDGDPAGAGAVGHPVEVPHQRAFALFWSASTLRGFGGAISGVAFQVLIVTVLHATPGEVSVLNALSVAPYVFLGLIVGALMDRWRRQRTLVVTSVGRAVALASVTVLYFTGVLSFWVVALITLVLGVLVLFGDSASQPLLPRLVPRSALVHANARLNQSATVASTAGPAIGGVLLSLVGTPILFAFDAVITGVAALLQSRIVVDEPAFSHRPPGRHIGHDIAEGLKYTYGHRMLRPLALSVHVWFLGNSIVATVFALFVLRHLAVPPWAYGVVLAFGGLGGFLGALIAPRVGSRLGVGHAILVGRAMVVLPWVALAAIPFEARDGLVLLAAVLAAAQFLYNLAMALEDANDTGYRQAVAPDAIQGRMNSTIRTVNRVVFLFGALLAGVLITDLGYRETIGAAAIVFAVAAAIILASPLRGARVEDVGAAE